MHGKNVNYSRKTFWNMQINLSIKKYHSNVVINVINVHRTNVKYGKINL